MRKFLLFVLVLAIIAGAVVAYLVLTTPKSSDGIRFPLSANHRALAARVPASAESFALVPTAAVLYGKLLANPVTRDPLLAWSRTRQLPKPWMLGRGDLVVWKSGKQVRYLVTLDPLRATLVRFFLLFQSGVESQPDQPVILINSSGEAPIAAADLDPLLALGSGLPPGDVFIVQREAARGAYPPIGRPSATSMAFGPREITVTSRARTDKEPHEPLRAKHPVGAIISGTFSEAPRIVNDLNRLFGANVSDVLRSGGSVAVYDVNTGTLVPRPKGIFTVRGDERTRSAMGGFLRVAELVGETRQVGDELVVSVDDQSMDKYLKDRIEPSPWPATEWTLRFSPPLLVPILEQVSANGGLRLGLPRIHRAARDLRRWVQYLDDASTVEAADAIEGGIETVRVRVTAK